MSSVSLRPSPTLPQTTLISSPCHGYVTSLNSGFRVFFFTHVLCLDLLSTSGLKYLGERQEHMLRDRTGPLSKLLGSGS
jgi:hypothetical protein